MRRVMLLFVFALTVGVAQAGFAQDRDEQAKPVAPTPQIVPPTGKVTPMAVPPPVAQKEDRDALKVGPPKMTNIQVEVTISDQIGNAAPVKKTVSLITSDASVGRIRSRAETNISPRGPIAVNLNIDAVPRVIGDQVQMDLTIEYNPLKTSADGSPEEKAVSPTQLNQQLRVVMNSGKWMTLSQAADPVTDRKIIVECKATILK